MASYDSSVLIKCMRGDDVACNVIFSDDNCVIPPTTYDEVKFSWNYDKWKEIKEHCKIYTYDEYPFNQIDIQLEIEDFVKHVDKKYLRPKRKTREARWFERLCKGSGNLEHRLNDYRIVAESSELGKLGLADLLVSADHAQTNDFCVAVYRKEMEEVDDELAVTPVFYKNLVQVAEETLTV